MGGQGFQKKSLAEEYRQRQKKMDSRLRQEIENNQIAPFRDKPQPPEEKREVPQNVSGEEELAQGFFRSKRNVALRIKDTYENQVCNLETSKLTLIQRLNDALVQLDKINQENTQISAQLIDKIKFVRDLQRETQKGDNLDQVVNRQLREDLQREKELSVKLREDLKRIEIERLQVLEHLNRLQNQSEQDGIYQGEMNNDLRMKAANLEALKEDYAQAQERIDETQKRLEELRALDLACKKLINEMTGSYSEMSNGREPLIDSIKRNQERLDNAIFNFENERRDIDKLQSRHLRLLSCYGLMQSLNMIFHFNQKYVLNHLFVSSKKESCQVKCLVKLRKILRIGRRRIKGERFHQWYRTILKPLNNRKQLMGVNKVLQKKFTEDRFFQLWRNLTLQKQSQKLLMHRAISGMLKRGGDMNVRSAQYAFRVWKSNLLKEESGQQALLRKVLCKKLRITEKAFALWRKKSIGLVFHVKMHAICQRIAHKKFLNILFVSWRSVVVKMREKRLAILNRVWKNLVKYKTQRTQFRIQAMSILREQKLSDEQILRHCFDALRFNKSSEKFSKTFQLLNEVEIPRADKAEKYISMMNQNDTRKHKDRSTKVVAKQIAKRLSSYFQKWKQESDFFQKRSKTDLVMRVLKTYNDKLKDAFQNWIVFKGSQMKLKQTMIMEEFSEEGQAIQNEIKLQRAKNQEMDQRSKSQSSKSIKKTMMGAFNRLLRERFNHWKKNHRIKEQKLDVTEKVMKRLHKRLKKLYFDKYKKLIEVKRQDSYNDKKLEEVKARMNEKIKKRIFEALRKFTAAHRRARKRLVGVMNSLDKSLKQKAIRKWVKSKELRKQKSLENKQNEKIQQNQDLISDIGGLEDQISQTAKANEAKVKNYERRSKRVLQTYVKYLFDLSQRQLFLRWKEKAVFLKTRDLKMRKAIIHYKRYALDYAFRQWFGNGSKTFMKFSQMESDSISRDIDTTEKKIKVTLKECEAVKEGKNDEMKKIHDQNQYLASKLANTYSQLAGRYDSNFKVSNKEYIFKAWAEYIKQRKNFLNKVRQFVQKTVWQKVFDKIREAGRKTNKSENKGKGMKKASIVLYKNLLRDAMNKWRKRNFQQVMMVTEEFEGEMNSMVQSRNEMKMKAKEAIVEQKRSHKGENKLFDCFVLWKQYIKMKKMLKSKVVKMKDDLHFMNLRWVIRKWSMRTKATRRVRRAANLTEFKSLNISMKEAFEGWKYFHFTQRFFTTGIRDLQIKMDHNNIKVAFEKIRWMGTHKANVKDRKWKLGFEQGNRLGNYLVNRKLLQGFLQFKNGCTLKKREDMTKKAMINRWSSCILKNYFLGWKENAGKREVVRFNLEEGPVAVEKYNHFRDLQSLKQLALRDGHTAEDIKDLIDQDNKKFQNLTDKSICRMICYNDDLYLLPWCIDRWKNYTKSNRLQRQAIQFMQNKTQFKKADLIYAFEKWKYRDHDKKGLLDNMKFEDLQKRCIENSHKIQGLADYMDEGQEMQEDLVDQRDMLLKSFIGSQKLALSVANASHDRAKFKAFSKYYQRACEGRSREYERIIQDNLDGIQKLKQRIKDLEMSNEEISLQNEDLRYGALDGIEMAHSIDLLTKEREKLSVDIADKAITIRKLLEDNSNLSTRLSNAQTEAQQLINVAKMKMSYDDAGTF